MYETFSFDRYSDPKRQSGTIAATPYYDLLTINDNDTFQAETEK